MRTGGIGPARCRQRRNYACEKLVHGHLYVQSVRSLVSRAVARLLYEP
jgi:hypothetical protein